MGRFTTLVERHRLIRLSVTAWERFRRPGGPSPLFAELQYDEADRPNRCKAAARSPSVTLEEGENGYYVVQRVEIPEAISQGRTKRGALKNITEAIWAVLEWRQKNQKEKPPEWLK